MVPGVVVPAGEPLDGADEPVVGYQAHHPVEGEAEEVLADAQDGVVVAGGGHHLLGLDQQAAHAGLDVHRNAVGQEIDGNRVV